jgi:hypothetical protein
MSKKTYVEKVVEKLKTLEIGESFDKKEYVKEVWGDDDYFVCRSFEVALAKSKKILSENSFKTIKGKITKTR